ncbi:MAG TPA: hypothetical protein VNU68_13440, partial [Verrucomicrobiae bacterium]|nr:hypothetical protein [Verrucomicrobiae bacterium]
MKPNRAVIPRCVRFPILLCQLLALCAAGGLLSSVAQAAATVTTDKPDYPPGSTVSITGSGFLSGETVQCQILHVGGGDDATSPAHQPWTVTADANGGFETTWTVPTDEDELGATLELTARGQSSGFTATATFTDDAPVRNYTASISPNTDTAGHVSSYTATIKNETSSNQELGSANITVPTGYSAVIIGTVTAPAGKTWTATLVSGVIQLRSNSSANRLSPGESVSVLLTATAPCTAGPYVWTTDADQNTTTISGGGNFDLVGSEPTVTITGSCNQAPSCNAGGPYSATCRTASINGATASDPDSDLLTYTWTSSDPNVTISPAGGIIAAGPGNRPVPASTATLSISVNPCNQSATLTLTINDGHGHSSTCTTTVTFNDNVNPTFSAFPPDKTVECPGLTDPSATGQPGGADTCGTATVSHTDSESANDCTQPGHVKKTIVRHWKV